MRTARVVVAIGTAAAAALAGALLQTASARPGATERAADPTCDGLTATIVGTKHRDTLTGTSGPDVIVGLGGNDTIKGLAGDDVICAGRGADDLLGGKGDDRLFGGNNGLIPLVESEPIPFGDTLVPGPGDDLVVFGTNTVTDSATGLVPDHLSFYDATAGIDLDLLAGTATGQGADTFVVPTEDPDQSGTLLEVIGSAFADHLLGTDLAEEFVGNGGGDEIRGRGGDDFIGETFDGEGGSGDDSFWGDAGDDYLDGGGGLDDLHGGDGNDGLRDVGGRVSVDGGAGNDSFSLRLRFADGQLVEGGDGRDRVTLFNFFGAHLQRVDVLADLPARVFTMSLHGAERSAEVGSVESLSLPDYGSWTILGTDASERFQAFVQSVEIHAGGGDDVLLGGGGDDLLAGGAGDDRANGRGGSDTCPEVEQARSCTV